MKVLTLILLIVVTISVKAQNIKNYELIIEKCIEDKYHSIGFDIEKEFDTFQDTLISQGILLDKNYKSYYALYDTILSGGFQRYVAPYYMDKLEENMMLFNECFFQFKSDTSTAFKETKLYDFYIAIEKINSLSNVTIDTIINSIKRVLSEEDLKSNIYKYYTLYSFHFLIIPYKITPKIILPESNIASTDKRTINVSIDKDQKYFINDKETKEEKIEHEIEKIIGGNSDDYIIVLYADKAAIINNVVKIMDIAKKKNIKLILGTVD